MTILDVIILAVMVYAVVKGWATGFIAQLASLVGYVVGLSIAWMCYGRLADYLAPHLGSSGIGVSALAFVLLLIGVPMLLGLVGRFFTKAADVLLLGAANRAIGAVLSLVKYTLLMGCVLLVLNALHILGEEKKEQSLLYDPVTAVWGDAWHKAIGCTETDRGADSEK